MTATHCRRGHVLVSPNLEPVALGKGEATCRSCDLAAHYINRRPALRPHFDTIAAYYYESFMPRGVLIPEDHGSWWLS